MADLTSSGPGAAVLADAAADAPGHRRAPAAAAPAMLRLALSAMATRFELVLVDDGRGEAALRAAGEAALAEVEEADRRFSRFRRDSLVRFLEREAWSRPARLDEPTFALFAECLEIEARSGGLFDIDIAEAMDQWRAGVDAEQGAGPGAGRVDEDAGALGEAAGEPAPARRPRSPRPALLLDPATRSVRLARPDVRLDLGGVAKGHAIDLAVAALRDAGVTCAFLHGGASAVAALGAPPGASGWRVAIELDAASPVPNVASPGRSEERGRLDPGRPCRRAVFCLRDEALCVSSPRGHVVDGRGHIIDPRTRESAQGAAAIAAVSGVRAATCDAWTKPLLIAARRPAGLPPELTSLVAVDGAASIEGRHAARVLVETRPAERAMHSAGRAAANEPGARRDSALR